MSIIRQLTTLIFIGFLTACSSLAPDTPEPSYYLFDTPLNGNPKANKQSVGIEVEVADYLHRPQMALRGSKNQIEFSDYHRWASELRGLIIDMLVNDLSIELDSERVFEYPWRLQDKVQHHIKIDISRLDGRLGERAYLQARTEIIPNESSASSKIDTYDLSITIASSEHNDLVLAKRELLKRLSQNIAASIQKL